MKIITANKLNRLWENGIIAKMVGKSRVLNTVEEVSANTNAENVTGALVSKELINNLGGCSLEQDGKEFYIVGADSVRKKLGSATWADVATTNINFSGSVHYAGDRVYSNSLPATYNGKTFLCLYFTANITGSAINSGYPVTVSPDRSNRRISFYTPVEMPGIVYCTATITGVYV